jgi:type I restriction enzyme M protein
LGKKRTSEFRSYEYIGTNLKKLGWDPRSPAKHPDGETYWQQECHDDERIKEQLNGMKPENVIKVKENEFYVIEAKPKKSQIDMALEEAKNDYAKAINNHKKISSRIITGIAGSDSEGYIIKNQFLQKNKFLPITVNGEELDTLISPQIANILLEKNEANIQDVPVDEKRFSDSAIKINEILHHSSINSNERARIISALLLSVVDKTKPNIDADPDVFFNDINARVKAVLKKSNKEFIYPFIKLENPIKEDIQKKRKDAFVKTLDEFDVLNIRLAMNSGTDVLGKFYEVFLKYGNGAKEIGIVLTPRHITKFAVDVLRIELDDIVFDPCCGTGGFLVAAYDYVKNKFGIENTDLFKENNIFGIEADQDVVALAIVNMIFRGDGKNNIIHGDTFENFLTHKKNGPVNTAKYKDNSNPPFIPPVNKVLMNPPFSKESSKEKEWNFIEHALKQMIDEGVLFSVLPRGVMVKSGKFKNSRKKILEKNTILAVVNFPTDLFYPTGTQTCGIFIKKGVPQQKNHNVLWLDIKTDGLLKSKGRRLPSSRTTNDLKEKMNMVKNFIADPTISIKNIPRVQKACPLDPHDELNELAPEVYFDEEPPTEDKLKSRTEQTVREFISFLVKDSRYDDFEKNVVNNNSDLFKTNLKKNNQIHWKEIPITDIFKTPLKTGDYHVSGQLDPGSIPLVSCSTENNGFEGKFDIPKNKTIKNAITIASDGQPLATFLHYFPFVTKDNVIICIPNKNYKFTTLLFFVTQLNYLKWRFSYGRKCYLNKTDKVKIFVPYKNKEIDEHHIEKLVKDSNSWEILIKIFKSSDS